jgi:hypothetical protein
MFAKHFVDIGHEEKRVSESFGVSSELHKEIIDFSG